MTATNDGIIHLKGRIRDGKLVALLDHEGKELGAPVTALESFTGGNEFSIGLTAPRMQIYKKTGLRRFFDALSAVQAGSGVINVNIGIDSLAAGTGSTGGANADASGDEYGLAGVLRKLFARHTGQVAAGFISADDARVTKAGSAAPIVNHGSGPAHSSSFGNSLRVAGTGVNYCSFSVPTATKIDIIDWQDTAATYNGVWAWSIDGGATTQVASVGGSSVYRTTTIAVAPGTHTLKIEAVSGQNAICGIRYYTDNGVAVNRMGVGGFTTKEYLAKFLAADVQDRFLRATFQTLQPSLCILTGPYNDWQEQTTGGTSVDVTKANYQLMIDAVLANATKGCVLLLAEPPTTSANPSGYVSTYSDYIAAMKSLADSNDHVAFAQWSDLIYTYADGSDRGLYADFIHQLNGGYALAGASIFGALTT